MSDSEPHFAVIVTSPSATPVTFPFATVAFVSSLVSQVIVPVAPCGSKAAVKFVDLPTSTSAVFGEMI